MNRLEQQLEVAGHKFDLACAEARDSFIRSMLAAGWTEEEARAAYRLNGIDVEAARAKMLSEVREWLEQG